MPVETWANVRCRDSQGLIALTGLGTCPVVTWGTPPLREGCRSASQGMTLTLLTFDATVRGLCVACQFLQEQYAITVRAS